MNTRLNPRTVAIVSGLLGPAVIAVGAAVTASAYIGSRGEPYSFLNHFISELGELKVSRYAHVFNVSLIMGGCILSVFMITLAMYLESKLAYLAGAVGAFSGLACAGVGMVPMDRLHIHVLVAFGFFYGGLAALGLFGLAILADRQGKVEKWLAIPSFAAAITFAAFVALPYLTGATHVESLDPHSFVRPRVWSQPLMEWCVLFAVMAWVLLMVQHLRRQGDRVSE